MRTLMLSGAAALALLAAPAVLLAQDSEPVPDTAETAAEPVPAAPVPPEPAPETAAEANVEATDLPTTREVLPGEAPGEPTTAVTTHHGNLTPPPATAFGKSYPVCTRTLQDSCRNPGEGEGDDTALGG